jgi:hypothetical protein
MEQQGSLMGSGSPPMVAIQNKSSLYHHTQFPYDPIYYYSRRTGNFFRGHSPPPLPYRSDVALLCLCSGKGQRSRYDSLRAGSSRVGSGIECWWDRDFPHPPRWALEFTQPPGRWVPVSCRKQSGRSVGLATRLQKEQSHTSTPLGFHNLSLDELFMFMPPQEYSTSIFRWGGGGGGSTNFFK